MKGTFSAEGITALSEAIKVTASVTECKLRGNELGVEVWTIIFNTLRDSPTSKIATWDLYDENLGPEIAKPLAEYISVTTSLTRLVLKDNNLGPEGARHLSEGLKINKSITELDISNANGSSSGDIRAEGAKYIADMLLFNASLTQVLAFPLKRAPAPCAACSFAHHRFSCA